MTVQLAAIATSATEGVCGGGIQKPLPWASRELVPPLCMKPRGAWCL